MLRRAIACAEKPARLETRVERPEAETLRPLLALLSAREAEIARFVADGLSNKEIGQALRISHHTVSTHLRRIFSKLDIGCRIELCRIVITDTRTAVSAHNCSHLPLPATVLAIIAGFGSRWLAMAAY